MNDNHVAFLDRNLMLIGKSDVNLCFTLIRFGHLQGASKKKSELKVIFTIKDSEWSTIKSYLILVNVLQTQNEARMYDLDWLWCLCSINLKTFICISWS